VLDLETPYDATLLKDIQIAEMYRIADSMIDDNLRSFVQADTTEARNIFRKDELMDDINKKATDVIATYISQHNESIVPSLNLMSCVRKLERIGDLNKNIAEEIIFFVEANVLKHEKEKI
jgi:phosphate transport system protein